MNLARYGWILFQAILFLFGALIFSQIELAQGNAAGAPASPDNCAKMYPQHGKDHQRIPPPYTIGLSRVMLRVGETTRIIISAPMRDTKIKGFFLQARRIDYRMSTMPWGIFSMDADYKGGQLIKCGNGTDEGNSFTHVDNTEKEDVRAVWMAPNMPGAYVILATLVKDGATFWVQQPSWRIDVMP